MAPRRGADERLAARVFKCKQLLVGRELKEIHDAFSPIRRNGCFRIKVQHEFSIQASASIQDTELFH